MASDLKQYLIRSYRSVYAKLAGYRKRDEELKKDGEDCSKAIRLVDELRLRIFATFVAHGRTY